MATYSSIPAWEIPPPQEPGGLLSRRSQSRTGLKSCSHATLKTQEDIPATGLTTNTCVHSRKVLLLIIFIRSFNKQALSAVCLRGQTQAPSPPAQKQKLSLSRGLRPSHQLTSAASTAALTLRSLSSQTEPCESLLNIVVSDFESPPFCFF